MKNILPLIGLMGVTLISVFGQTTPSPATPSPVETQKQIQESRERDIQQNQRIINIQNPRTNPQYDIDRDRARMIRDSSAVPISSISRNTLPPLISKDQARRRLPNSEDSVKYAAFLKLPKTGLIRLFPDLDCFTKAVVRIDGPCQDAIPQSNYYSFRKKSYSSKAFSDVGVKDDSFLTDGWLSQGIMVLLGDVPMETASLKDPGLEFLSNYKPAANYQEILNKFRELGNGLKDGNYTYTNRLSILENTTYAIRVIAYRSELLLPLGQNVALDLLENDKRVDIIAVFRVVRKDNDGSLTLLWKEIQRKNSPRISLSKREQELIINRSSER